MVFMAIVEVPTQLNLVYQFFNILHFIFLFFFSPFFSILYLACYNLGKCKAVNSFGFFHLSAIFFLIFSFFSADHLCLILKLLLPFLCVFHLSSFTFLLFIFLGHFGETNRRDSHKYMSKACSFREEGKASKGTSFELSQVQFN